MALTLALVTGPFPPSTAFYVFPRAARVISSSEKEAVAISYKPL